MHSGFTYIVFLKGFLSLKPDFPFGLRIGAFNNILLEEKATPLKKTTGSYSIRDIPNYFTLNYTKIPKSYNLISLDTIEGYYIDLAFKDIKDYLRQQFGSKSRWSLYRDWDRLEHCFDISYVVYYGSIDKELYNSLFQRLREMMVRRFNEKAEANYELPHLAEMREVLYDLIQQKKANLYVIYHNNIPISIRINMFKDDLAYYILSAYDIDYSKFHLGHLDMMQNIAWCINNKFKIYDLLKGYYDYKKKWITHCYTNQTHLLFPGNRWLPAIEGKLKRIKMDLHSRLLRLAKRWQLHKPFKYIKMRIYSMRKPLILNTYVIRKNIEGIHTLEKIDILEDVKYHFLKRPVFNFLYVSRVSLESIQVYSTQHPHVFKINGAALGYLIRKDTTTKFK